MTTHLCHVLEEGVLDHDSDLGLLVFLLLRVVVILSSRIFLTKSNFVHMSSSRDVELISRLILHVALLTIGIIEAQSIVLLNLLRSESQGLTWARGSRNSLRCGIVGRSLEMAFA